MGDLIKRLWAGEVPLEQAFWGYAVVIGLLVNLVTSGAFLALLSSDSHLVVLVLVYALPLPYNLLAVVAVWRSAQRYPGPKKWAQLAQVGTVLWMLLLSLT